LVCIAELQQSVQLVNTYLSQIIQLQRAELNSTQILKRVLYRVANEFNGF